MKQEKLVAMPVSTVYPLYLQKIERKGRTQDELDTIISWLTGYDKASLYLQLANDTDFKTFFAKAPRIHPHAHKITGLICGHRIELIADPLMQQIRYLDKLVDELAKGKPMEKILRP